MSDQPPEKPRRSWLKPLLFASLALNLLMQLALVAALTGFRTTIDKVVALAEDMLERGQTTPIRLRPDGDRYVLIEGLHRLEALRALGELTVEGYLVRARLH